MKVIFEPGETISVRYGTGPRTTAVVLDGPHRFTSWERKQAVAAKEKAELKTNRVPKTYYRARVEGTNKVIRALGGHIRRVKEAASAETTA